MSSIGEKIANLPAAPGPAPSTSAGPVIGRAVARPGTGPSVLVPAGFLADVLGGLSGTIGEVAGGVLGNPTLGRRIGDAASPLVKLLPFDVVAPGLAPQSADAPADGGGATATPAEPLVVVPAGFLGGLLAGIGGNLLGGVVGKWLGSEDTGKTVGSTIGTVVGGVLPFGVVPPAVTPQSAGPDDQNGTQALVVVPAGFFGNLLGGLAGTLGDVVAGRTGRKVGELAAPLIRDLVPFQDVPADLDPQSAGPDDESAERMILVPAGLFGNLLSGLAGTIGGAVGGLFGNAQTGRTIGEALKPVAGLIPFHEAPPELLPQSAEPGGIEIAEKMILVPAGLFGNLLSGLAGTIGGAVGGLFGNAQTGRDIGNAAAPVLSLIPFQQTVR